MFCQCQKTWHPWKSLFNTLVAQPAGTFRLWFIWDIIKWRLDPISRSVLFSFLILKFIKKDYFLSFAVSLFGHTVWMALRTYQIGSNLLQYLRIITTVTTAAVTTMTLRWVDGRRLNNFLRERRAEGELYLSSPMKPIAPRCYILKHCKIISTTLHQTYATNLYDFLLISLAGSDTWQEDVRVGGLSQLIIPLPVLIQSKSVTLQCHML